MCAVVISRFDTIHCHLWITANILESTVVVLVCQVVAAASLLCALWKADKLPLHSKIRVWSLSLFWCQIAWEFCKLFFVIIYAIARIQVWVGRDRHRGVVLIVMLVCLRLILRNFSLKCFFWIQKYIFIIFCFCMKWSYQIVHKKCVFHVCHQHKEWIFLFSIYQGMYLSLFYYFHLCKIVVLFLSKYHQRMKNMFSIVQRSCCNDIWRKIALFFDCQVDFFFCYAVIDLCFFMCRVNMLFAVFLNVYSFDYLFIMFSVNTYR